MIDVNQLRKGTTFTIDGEIYRVVEFQHYKPGRGNAVIRTKIRNLRTGSSLERNFTSGNKVEDIRLERVEVQYLYHDDDFYYFMNTRTFEQIPVSATVLGDSIGFLLENMTLDITSYEGEVLDVELPINVDLKVVDAPVVIAGDTATGVTKLVTLESGFKLTVPLFVTEGDTIRVDTRTGAYVTRV